MTKFSTEVDAYVATAQDFAKPILEHWRELIHVTCPDVVEAIKWSLPHFDYKNDFMCVMTAHKSHCSFMFVKAPLMTDPRLKESKSLKPSQRFLGKITQFSDLPSDEEFIAMIREAMDLNEKGIKLPHTKSETSKVVETPSYFSEALDLNPDAKAVFESKSPSYRKDYIAWISDAKTETTRNKRMDQAIEWIAEGKDRFWQYKK